MAALMSGSARLSLPGAAGRLGRWAVLHLQERRRKRFRTSNVPVAPTGLTVFEDGADAYLNWEDHSGNESGFRVYRNGVLYGTSPAGQPNFDDAGIVTATTYTYFVVAYNAQGDSAPSNKVTVTIGAS